jgi:hypothetical protein
MADSPAESGDADQITKFLFTSDLTWSTILVINRGPDRPPLYRVSDSTLLYRTRPSMV